MYEIQWDEKVRDFLRTLPKDIAQRIFQKVELARINPNHFLERLKGMDSCKLRVGDYRLIIDIDEHRKLIEVRFAGHRKNIYKKFRE